MDALSNFSSDDEDSFDPNGRLTLDGLHLHDQGFRHAANSTDISLVPDDLAAYPDDALDQSAILTEIIGTRFSNQSYEERFNNMPQNRVRLSALKSMYDRREKNAVNLLSTRRFIHIDDEFKVPLGNGQVLMNTDECMIDYHLTVANRIGFSAFLPNAPSSHPYSFYMDLKKPYVSFKGKHAMLGFDPAGCMLYVGRSNGEDVFLAMAPNDFLRGRSEPCPPGHSSGSPVMSKRHYRQTVMMLAHFLACIPQQAIFNVREVYDQDLDSSNPRFEHITNLFSSASHDTTIKLNLEDVQDLDKYMVEGYDAWVNDAPDAWKVDGFLVERSPIVVTSRFGQNARIAILGNEAQEAEAWQRERDYSKLAFVTFAIATSIKCTEIRDWIPISNRTIKENNPGQIYDGSDPLFRKPVRLRDVPLLDDEGQEIPIYNSDGDRIRRREVGLNDGVPPCGVLVDLQNIQALFDPYSSDHDHEREDASTHSSELEDTYAPRVDVYPLAFLRTVGNLQANGIPPCFYPLVTEINRTVGKERHGSDPEGSWWDEGRGVSSEDEEAERSERTPTPTLRAVKPVSCQFYNYMMHRVATRAGQYDSQQGMVTAAISGAFANTERHKDIAADKQSHCSRGLPSDRFHSRFSLEDCPTSCRAEFVYSVDVRALEDPSGRSIFNDIVLPLARSWSLRDVRRTVMDHLVVLKPKVFPNLFDWVAYPVTTLIRSLYTTETRRMTRKKLPCPFRLELVASLERILCFCHTGNAAVLATSLMNPLGLSRGVVKDGYPMLHKVFVQPTISSAMERGLEVDRRAWPLKGGYPAVASKRAQVVTYSLEHFMAYQTRLRIEHARYIPPLKSYPGVSMPKMTIALHVCEIAFDAFFEDTKHLVAVGVRADIARRSGSASSAEDLARISSRGKLREERLRSWLKTSFPLAYGVQEKESAYKLLLEAVSPDDQAVARGLPNWSEFCTSYQELAEMLSSMSRPRRPTATKAPVVRNGSFLPVLKIVHQTLLEFLEANVTEEAREEHVTWFFRKSLKIFQVRYFPAAKPRSGMVGAPNSKPAFDSWGNLSKRDRGGAKSLKGRRSRADQETVPAATVALNNAIAEDCNAEWSAKDLDLRTLRMAVRKTTLPTDFRVPSLANEKYVDDTYEWVKENYDGTKKVHHLALLVGIIVASTLVPDLFMPTGMKKRFLDAKTEDMVREVFDEMKWESKAGKRGMSDRGIFVGMFTTFIIALYEEESPLRKHMGGSQRRGLGDVWTAKHSVKGVTYNNLIRLGMLWGKGPGAYERGLFGQSWGCHSPERMGYLHDVVCKKLGEEPFRPFDILNLLIGEKNAREFCRKSRLNFTCRPPSTTTIADSGLTVE